MLSFGSRLLIAGRAWAEHSRSPPGGQEAERREEGERETVPTLIGFSHFFLKHVCMCVYMCMHVSTYACVLTHAHEEYGCHMSYDSLQEWVLSFSRRGHRS